MVPIPEGLGALFFGGKVKWLLVRVQCKGNSESCGLKGKGFKRAEYAQIQDSQYIAQAITRFNIIGHAGDRQVVEKEVFAPYSVAEKRKPFKQQKGTV